MLVTVYTVLQVGCFMAVAQWYFWVSVRKLCFMYFKHRFAFRQHAPRNIIQVVATYIALWILTIGTAEWVFIYICRIDRQLEKQSVGDVDSWMASESLCSVVKSGIE